jgi:glycerol-3-phosphate acyltransferase PlsY
MEIVKTIGMIALGYLSGSILTCLLIGRRVGIDLYRVGSRNPGAANLYRKGGRIYGIIGFILDAAKGVIPVFLANGVLGLSPWMAALVGIAAIVGHDWPLYFGFRGGRGLSTSIGVTAYLLFLPFLIALLVGAFVGLIARGIPAIRGCAIPIGGAAGFLVMVIFSTYNGEPAPLTFYVFAASIVALIRNFPPFLRLVREWRTTYASPRV